ncbi:amidohydrolase family protein [Marinihelvus fidelis]|uniref:Amidohydrolase family protein n=1 Tax=Marinihelvus fidelis TaxID=2613842 RepID=A0A5N0T4K0_9GAMM|nr:amidohydrolase family protein [Marinihelvus fidelis]KAA9129782.1 amidohydrolase family protein [Marinihelvus fidelis]
MKKLIFSVLVSWVALHVGVAWPAPEPAPERQRGEGPFDRLVLRGVMVVNGEGAPPIGPADVLVEGNRISQIKVLGIVTPAPEENRIEIQPGDQVLELDGHWLLPGFVDMHGHFGGDDQGVPAEYVAKLWLAHGVTTVREPGSFNGLEWVLGHQRRSANNTIAAPRIVPYVGFGMGHDGPFTAPDQAREWVRDVAGQGAAGVKFFGAPRDIMLAALDEMGERGLGGAMHHAQLDVVNWNVLDSARNGMTTMEHWYGLPEAMFEGQVIQDYPLDYNYANEQHRFGEAGRLWQQTAAPGSEKWNAVRDELIALDFTLDPTLTIYEASRDLMREMNADWHEDYTHPALWSFFQPSFEAHGSYWFDWTTADEIAWKENFRLWMQFLDDYKNHGGRVTLGSDSGYIWKTYGFGYIREMELLQEAGFHPLEVLRSATWNGAEVLGMDGEIGSIRVGKLADLVVVPDNPLRNFKVLYATGHFKLDDDGVPMRTSGIRYTIKDGIVYDVAELLADVRKIVAAARAGDAAPDSAAGISP